MDPLKALNLCKGNLLNYQGVGGLFRAPLSLKEREGKISFQALSLRLNVRPYNKLSKEVEDFRDLCGEYIYIQYQTLNKYYKKNVYLQKYT